MDAMVGGSEDRLLDSVVDDGLVDGVVNNWCGLRHWDHTAAHLAGKAVCQSGRPPIALNTSISLG